VLQNTDELKKLQSELGGAKTEEAK